LTLPCIKARMEAFERRNMSKTTWQTVLLVMALFLLLPAAGAAQGEKSSSPQKSASTDSKALKAPGQPPLQSVTLVNTAEAARQVAKEASARAQAPKAASTTSNKTAPQPEAGGAVLELHPADLSDLAETETRAVQTKSPKKSVLKNIHGSAYGAAVSQVGQANGEGGDVGADSSNGKFNIYLEGEHAHASTPAPH
jgi:hypothetical protein